MTKRFFGVLAVAVLVVAVAAPLSAQSVSLTANIPFEFAVGNLTLPAGSYRVVSTDRPDILIVGNYADRTAFVAQTTSIDNGRPLQTGTAHFVFNRYGEHYVLSQIWDGFAGAAKQFPMSKTERELAKTASSEKVEVLGLLARR